MTFVCRTLLPPKVQICIRPCHCPNVNIAPLLALAVADAIRTSLGPRGMDKMIQKGDGEVLITNDGATILSQLQVFHPTAQMLVQLSKSQDIEAGDGTTGICVIAGALLQACSELLAKGIHPTMIAEAFKLAAAKAHDVLVSVAKPVDLLDRQSVLDAVNTCLSSKVVHAHSDVLAPISVDAVLGIIDPATATNVDLNDVKIVKQVGGTMDDTELVRGLVLERAVKSASGGPVKVENAKIALIQFCLSAPKTDMENNVVVSDYAAMDRILREERKYILNQCKKIKKWGCNVLLIQKSILRDAYNDLSLHFLAKLDIMVVTDIERTEVDFICRTLQLQPIAHIDHFSPDKMGSCGLAHEVTIAGSTSKVVKFTDIVNMGPTITILMRGSNKLVLDEADRSVHDALCVVRSLVKKRFLIGGGGAPEAECSLRLTQWAKTLTGVQSYCVRAFAEVRFVYAFRAPV
jgi:T-complex protein 1 subunit delta